jgi:hypothetical protein
MNDVIHVVDEIYKIMNQYEYDPLFLTDKPNYFLINELQKRFNFDAYPIYSQELTKIKNDLKRLDYTEGKSIHDFTEEYLKILEADTLVNIDKLRMLVADDRKYIQDDISGFA